MPGQSWFTSGIEITIDGKHCLFTADNFFHQDQFSGTGGWMGLNRSSPVPYGRSAQKVLDLAPEWVLAEHGGPYVFSAEDYKRRVKWGEAAGKACDALCVSGRHLRDWTPHRVTAEPVLQTPQNDTITVTFTLAGTGAKAEEVTLRVLGRGVFNDFTTTIKVRPGQAQPVIETVGLTRKPAPGRYVFPVIVTDADGAEPVDAFFALDVP